MLTAEPDLAATLLSRPLACACCGTPAARNQATCDWCGEGSWVERVPVVQRCDREPSTAQAAEGFAEHGAHVRSQLRIEDLIGRHVAVLVAGGADRIDALELIASEIKPLNDEAQARRGAGETYAAIDPWLEAAVLEKLGEPPAAETADEASALALPVADAALEVPAEASADAPAAEASAADAALAELTSSAAPPNPSPSARPRPDRSDRRQRR